MNEVSIILNGVRYDAVEARTDAFACEYCDIHDYCNEINKATDGSFSNFCGIELGDDMTFKKSTKSFER